MRYQKKVHESFLLCDNVQLRKHIPVNRASGMLGLVRAHSPASTEDKTPKAYFTRKGYGPHSGNTGGMVDPGGPKLSQSDGITLWKNPEEGQKG